ncbi:major facilitator superfamily transporter [Colletotrichum paranaense]|uniref:Major facilitator superfamily transporter n=1 Tax=Colletotrichum paranaense TaxID=1914294 RepID=A0ABQ9SCL5_9PEZI|nr:major facilitator superfamily transporter [Colletotrichum paranaense]KAK1533194.1 major facilitator superfamily transporter [Colletotrichum paranaense]
MASTEVADPELVRPMSGGGPGKKSFHEVERTISNEKADHQRLENVDNELSKYVGDGSITVSRERSDQLRKMIDKRVLVIMIGTYFLQAIDKGTMSFASIMGLQEDTHLKGQEFSWLTTCIYIAILFVEYPQNYIIARVPIAKYLSFSIIAWGAVLACHAACTDFKGLVIVRTLLGIFESACQPAFVILSSMWYRREEQASRVTYWYMMNGAQQVVGGLLAYCFTHIKTGPLKSWQWLFLAYGVVSVIFGIFVLLWMPDSPMRAKCYSEEVKREMVERVRDNQTGIQNKTFKREQAIEALKDPQVWGYSLIALCTTLPTSGLGAFANIIIKSFGFNTLEVQLLAMVLGFYIIFVLLGSVWLVKKFNQNLYVMLGFCVPSVIGTVLLMTVPNNTFSQRVGLLICYYITLSFWSAQTLALSLISRNVAGQTKKQFAVAINFIVWAGGNAIGPQVFLKWDGPRYFIAFATHLGCYALLIIVIICLRIYLSRENRKRDEMVAAGIPEASPDYTAHAFEDKTDKENLSFRYVF